MTIQDVADELRKHDGAMPDPGGPSGAIIPPPGTSGFLIRYPKGATHPTGPLPTLTGWGQTGINGGAFKGIPEFASFHNRVGVLARRGDYGAVLEEIVNELADRGFDVTGPDPINGRPFSMVADAIKQVGSETKPERGPLGKLAGLLYEHLLTLPEHKAMDGPAILDWFLDEHKEIVSHDTLYKELCPALRSYGLKNRPRIGYYIPPSDRPEKI
jgi:hypothetical protein